MILFVDDDPLRAKHYTEELEVDGYEVSLQTRVDDAWKYFEANRDRIEFLVLDIMMPSGELLAGEDTDSGFTTGFFFYKKIRLQALDLPVIILTNVNEAEVPEEGINEPNCWFRQKVGLPPFELVDEIKRIQRDMGGQK